MAYRGKKFLHNFLTERGFLLPPIKETAYGKQDGNEWLRAVGTSVYCINGRLIDVATEASEEKQFGRTVYAFIGGEWTVCYTQTGDEIEVLKQVAFEDGRKTKSKK